MTYAKVNYVLNHHFVEDYEPFKNTLFTMNDLAQILRKKREKSGSISFELLSRGCRSVTAVEKNSAHAAFISKVAKELKTDALSLIRGDAFRFLQGAQTDSFDFIFADPPYALEDFQEVPKQILERNLLREGGIFVMEHSKQYDFSALPYFQQHRVYGSVNFSIFIREEAKTDA